MSFERFRYEDSARRFQRRLIRFGIPANVKYYYEYSRYGYVTAIKWIVTFPHQFKYIGNRLRYS